jgi:peptide/bleomycin uptake transporter
MWKFFIKREWFLWSWGVSMLILASTWYQVELDVKINKWFGGFYDMLQQALAHPGVISASEYYGFLASFGQIAALYVSVALITSFVISHWIFRWRQSMVDHYQSLFHKARNLEGSSQRIQEDTIRFARIVETLGVGLMDSVLTLIAFFPILIGLSASIKILPVIGEVTNSLIWVAMFTALGGTILLASVGIKLPGIEYDIQRREAAYRKELVRAEDDTAYGSLPTLETLFKDIRAIHFKSYMHYAYFNMARYGYSQAMVLIPYIALGPSILGGVLTLGVMQQTIRAFGRVQDSMQYLVKSWGTIIELISVYKRLREFEKAIAQ